MSFPFYNFITRSLKKLFIMSMLLAISVCPKREWIFKNQMMVCFFRSIDARRWEFSSSLPFPFNQISHLTFSFLSVFQSILELWLVEKKSMLWAPCIAILRASAHFSWNEWKRFAVWVKMLIELILSWCFLEACLFSNKEKRLSWHELYNGLVG